MWRALVDTQPNDWHYTQRTKFQDQLGNFVVMLQPFQVGVHRACTGCQ